MVVLGLCCCPDFSLFAASRGYSLSAVHRLLIAVASLLSALGHDLLSTGNALPAFPRLANFSHFEVRAWALTVPLLFPTLALSHHTFISTCCEHLEVQCLVPGGEQVPSWCLLILWGQYWSCKGMVSCMVGRNHGLFRANSQYKLTERLLCSRHCTGEVVSPLQSHHISKSVFVEFQSQERLHGNKIP